MEVGFHSPHRPSRSLVQLERRATPLLSLMSPWNKFQICCIPVAISCGVLAYNGERVSNDVSGNEVMYSGHTGRMLEAQIFIGPTYYQVSICAH